MKGTLKSQVPTFWRMKSICVIEDNKGSKDLRRRVLENGAEQSTGVEVTSGNVTLYEKQLRKNDQLRI